MPEALRVGNWSSGAFKEGPEKIKIWPPEPPPDAKWLLLSCALSQGWKKTQCICSTMHLKQTSWRCNWSHPPNIRALNGVVPFSRFYQLNKAVTSVKWMLIHYCIHIKNISIYIYIILYCIVQYYIVLCFIIVYVILYYIILYYIILYYTILYDITSYQIKLYYIILYYYIIVYDFIFYYYYIIIS